VVIQYGYKDGNRAIMRKLMEHANLIPIDGGWDVSIQHFITGMSYVDGDLEQKSICCRHRTILTRRPLKQE
jgi:hypothetical protein